MSRFQLIAVCPRGSARDAVRALAAAAPSARPQAAEFGDLAAILAAEPTPLWRTRRRLGRSLVERQRRLETLHGAAATLAAAPGAAFESVRAAEAFLAGAAAPLNAAIAAFGGAEQHQIVVVLEAGAALQMLKGGTAWADAQEHAAAGDRGQAGLVLRDAAAALRARLAAEAAAALETAADELIRLPEGEEDVALNTVLLHPKGAGGAVETALERVDAAWDGAPRFKMIGPSPALSFAAVRVERPEPRALAAAAQSLGVTLEAELEAIKAAYHDQIRLHHPDRAGPAGVEATQSAAAAFELLSRAAAARDALAAAGFDPAAPCALARIAREGDAAPADAAPIAA